MSGRQYTLRYKFKSICKIVAIIKKYGGSCFQRSKSSDQINKNRPKSSEEIIFLLWVTPYFQIACKMNACEINKCVPNYYF